jgi:transposase-like protein
MSRKVNVQCPGSGMKAATVIGGKRATCPRCHRQQNVASNGNIRRHNAWRSKKALK